MALWLEAVTGAKKVAGRDYALAQAYLEGELIDSSSGERAAAIVVTNLVERVSRFRKKDKMRWDSIEEDLNDYAKEFSQEVIR